MAKKIPVKPRRGLEAGRTGVTPDSGELIVTTDNRTLHLGDGATAGANDIRSRALLESGGQALTLGAVSDGQILTRSGTTIVGTAASVSDHGALSGRADDDHPQYFLRSAWLPSLKQTGGAVGDGTYAGGGTDDSAAFDAAITAALAADPPGLLVEPGYYRVPNCTMQNSLPADFKFVTIGDSKPVIDYGEDRDTHTISDANVLFWLEGDDIEFGGVQFTRFPIVMAASRGETWAAGWTYDSFAVSGDLARLTVRDCAFVECSFVELFRSSGQTGYNAVSDIVFDRNRITDCRHGVYAFLTDAHRFRFTNNHCKITSEAEVTTADTKWQQLAAFALTVNSATQAEYDLAQITNGSGDHLIAGNTFEDAEWNWTGTINASTHPEIYHVLVTGQNRVTITNNHFGSVLAPNIILGGEEFDPTMCYTKVIGLIAAGNHFHGDVHALDNAGTPAAFTQPSMLQIKGDGRMTDGTAGPAGYSHIVTGNTFRGKTRSDKTAIQGAILVFGDNTSIANNDFIDVHVSNQRGVISIKADTTGSLVDDARFIGCSTTASSTFGHVLIDEGGTGFKVRDVSILDSAPDGIGTGCTGVWWKQSGGLQDIRDMLISGVSMARADAGPTNTVVRINGVDTAVVLDGMIIEGVVTDGLTSGDRGVMVENFTAANVSGLVVRDCDFSGITTPIFNPDNLPVHVDNDNIGVAPTTGWINAANYGWHPLASGATNLAALDAAFVAALAASQNLYIPGGGAYELAGTFSPSGHSMTMNSDGESGNDARGLDIHIDGPMISVPVGAAATAYHECFSQELVNNADKTLGHLSVTSQTPAADIWMTADFNTDYATSASAPIVDGSNVPIKHHCFVDFRGCGGDQGRGLRVTGSVHFKGQLGIPLAAFGVSLRGVDGDDGRRMDWGGCRVTIEDFELPWYHAPNFDTAGADKNYIDLCSGSRFGFVEIKNCRRAGVVGANGMDLTKIEYLTVEGVTYTGYFQGNHPILGGGRWNFGENASVPRAMFELDSTEMELQGGVICRNNGATPASTGAGYFISVGEHSFLTGPGILQMDGTDLRTNYGGVVYVGTSQAGQPACRYARVDINASRKNPDKYSGTDEGFVVLNVDQASSRRRSIKVVSPHLSTTPQTPVHLTNGYPSNGTPTASPENDTVEIQQADLWQESIILNGVLHVVTDHKEPKLIEEEETASFTFDLTHGGVHFVSANHATVAITATVPPNSTTAFPIGHTIIVEQRGAAAVTIAAGGGVTINKPSTKTLVLAEQHAQAVLRKTATDTWVLGGELTAA